MFFDFLLQLQDHGTGGIDDLDVVAVRYLVGFGRFAMGTEQDLHVVELLELVVVDGDESEFLQALALHAVVHDVAKAIKGGAICQLFFGLADGGGDPKTESAATVDFYLHID